MFSKLLALGAFLIKLFCPVARRIKGNGKAKYLSFFESRPLSPKQT